MSTTPSTSERGRIPYTIVGGKGGDRNLRAQRPLGCLVLHRGGSYQRSSLFTHLNECGIDEIVSVENSRPRYDVEELSDRFPATRFLLLHSEMTPGEQINIGMNECFARYVYVIWNDVHITPISEHIRARLERERELCFSPAIRNERGEAVPNIIAPAFYRGLLRIVPQLPGPEQTRTLFPFDYIGLYNRDLFLQLQGFDRTLSNPYWQKLDFGFRAFMWGESIHCLPSLRAQHLSQLPPDDTTPDESYRRFYLKNLAVIYNGDHARLPAPRFFGFLVRTKGGLLSSYKLFREIRRWINKNRFRFRQNARSVTDLWEFERP